VLTEREAWLAIAEVWSSPIESENTWLASTYDCGLCPSIGRLFTLENIRTDIAQSMFKKIVLYRQDLGITTAFVWPRTLDGAKARAEFCKTQAEKL
jgi:hypothetical protein